MKLLCSLEKKLRKRTANLHNELVLPKNSYKKKKTYAKVVICSGVERNQIRHEKKRNTSNDFKKSFKNLCIENRLEL